MQHVWRLFAIAVAVLLIPVRGDAQQEIIAAIQIQGNTLTTDADVIQASGLAEGMLFSERMLGEAAARLTATKQFRHVAVLKRYASIADPTQVVVLIRVDEGPVRVTSGRVSGQPPRVTRRSPINVMFVPILDAEDGYGLTYGVNVALAGNSTRSGRIIFPLSWGGDKRAGFEYQKELNGTFAPAIKGGMFVQRRTHPFFQSNADRRRVWGRGEWSLPLSLRAGTTVAWQRTTLLGRTDAAPSVSADLVLDTRVDTILPRNAVYARTEVERLKFPSVASVATRTEANGYVGVYGGSIVILRATRDHIGRGAPPYYKSILGGSESLRGFRAGTAVGDTMVTGSAELRIPVSSALSIAKVGVSAFVDIGTAYDNGERLSDQSFKRGVGGGVWAAAPLFRISLMVAHGIGAGTRVHFGAGLTF